MPSNNKGKKFIITLIDFVCVGQLPNLQKVMMVTTFVGSLEVKLGKKSVILNESWLIAAKSLYLKTLGPIYWLKTSN